MPRIRFFSREVIGKIPLPERKVFTDLASSLSIPDGFPFEIGAHGLPDAIVDDFAKYLHDGGRNSPNTWMVYVREADLFKRYMAAQDLAWTEATYEDIKAYRKVRMIGSGQDGRPIKGQSWNVAATAIRHLFEFGINANLVEETPIHYRTSKGRFRKSLKTHTFGQKVTPAPINFISIKNYKTLWRPKVAHQWVNAQRDLALDDLLIVSGLRISEATNLKIRSLPKPDAPQFAGKKTVRLTITGKGGKKRNVLVPKKYIRAIWTYIEGERIMLIDRKKLALREKWSEPPEVFLSRTGKKLSSRAVEKRFKELSDKLDFHLTPHGCRHTFAIYQLEAMIKTMALNLKRLRETGSDAYRQIMMDPLRQLQKLLGHSQLSTTFVYLDFVEEAEQLVEDSLADWSDWMTESKNE